ncbi:MAG: winged helix-turn-helix domain-containing protein [Rhizobiaceae bacterium]|nr:winged helix-turn-helix domain-containing protein [Rhizobiaceae bacterium]
MLLVREGVAVGLGTRGAVLLNALLAAGGDVVTKQELLDAAWPGVVVEENNLSVQIAALRKALGEQQSGQDWIVTVPRLGYRLPVPARAVSEQGGAVLPALAVLPFLNLGGDPDQEYFSHGIVGDITTVLSRFRGFAVVSRSSAFAYKGRTVDARQVGRELGVRYVLEGSIRSVGERFRLNADLVETETGVQLWADRFEGPRSALFEAQDQITDSVVRAIQPSITRAEVARARLKRTSNLTAYDLYLRALPELYYREGRRATDLLEEALRLDPGFMAAAAVAGNQYLAGYFHQAPGSSPADLERARVLLQKVLPVCGHDSMLLSNCATMLMSLGEYDEALDLAERAVAENPNDPAALAHAGVVHLFAGSLETSARLHLRGLALNPNDMAAHGQLTSISHVRIGQGDFEQGLVWAKRSLAASAHYGPTYWMLIAGNAHLGRMDEAGHYVGELRRIVPGVTVARIRHGLHARDPRRVDVLLEAMAQAGMPDT